jgi:GMP reductase
VPIVVANMDTTGTFAMATALAPFQVLTALHKHYELESEWIEFDKSAERRDDATRRDFNRFV